MVTRTMNKSHYIMIKKNRVYVFYISIERGENVITFTASEITQDGFQKSYTSN